MSVAGQTSPIPHVTPRITVRGLGAVLLVAGACALPLLLYAPFYTEPFMRDEGLYATVAQIMKAGGIPYQDHFDNKPPLIFGWYYLSFAVFGEHVWAPRLMVALLLSLTTLLVYVQGRLMFSHGYGVMAAFAFGLSQGLVKLQASANTEAFMLLPLVAGLVAFTVGQRTGSFWWYGLAGFSSGLAIATKEISLFPYIFLALLAAWPHVRERGLPALARPEFRRSAGGLVLGCFAAFVAVIAPFAATGTLPELFEATVAYTVKYVAGPSHETKLAALAVMPLFVVLVLGPWLVLGIAGVLHSRDGAGSSNGRLLAGWFAASLLGIIVAGRFYNHYFVALLPCLALLAPLGGRYLVAGWRSVRKDRHLSPAAVLILLLPLVTLVQLAQNAAVFLEPTPEQRHTARYPGDYRVPWENDGPLLGAWIAERTQPGDTIYNLGFQSEIYFYADRLPATRFLLDRPFWYSDSYIEQAVSELNESRPAYVIDSAIKEKPAEGKTYATPVKQWVLDNYEYVGKIYYADVWRLKAETQ